MYKFIKSCRLLFIVVAIFIVITSATITGCVSIGVSASKSFGGSKGFDTGVGVGVHKTIEGKKDTKEQPQDDQPHDEQLEDNISQN